jgi:hypothetical protein
MNRTAESDLRRLAGKPSGRPKPGHQAGPERSARWGGAFLLFLFSLIWASRFVPFGADLYDEGLLANGSALTLHGQLPGASFYAPYPPGVFYTLALLFRLFGVRLIVERWFAAVLAALIAALGFTLLAGVVVREGRPTGRRYLALCLLGLSASLLLSSRWLTPVNGGALLLALVSGLALQAFLPAGNPIGACLCGALLGLTVLWRQDFGLYAAAATVAVWYWFAGHASEAKASSTQRFAGAALMVAAMLAVAAPPLAWLVLQGGPRAAASLFWWPITSTGAARLPWTHHWPAFLVPLTSVLLARRSAPCLRRSPARAATTAWLLILGAGFLLYALGRTHATHLLPLRLVALLLVALSLSRFAGGDGGSPARARLDRSDRSDRSEDEHEICHPTRHSCLSPASDAATGANPIDTPEPHSTRTGRVFELLVLVTIFTATAVGPAREYLKAGRLGTRRLDALPGFRGEGVYPPRREAAGYDWVVNYLEQHVPEGEPIFCAAPRHDLFLKDDNLAYFLSGRLPGTYYWCLDAGVTSRLPVQREMIRELAASHTAAVLIRTDCINRERNAGSRSSGVHLLDQYLHDHFQLAAERGHYQVYRSTVGNDPSRAARKRDEKLLSRQDSVVVVGHLGFVR